MAQLKDLIVTGAARFLNIIHGSIDGNAASADKVNHTLTITPSNGTGIMFNGLDDCTLLINADSIGLSGTMRLVGKVPDNEFGVDAFDERYGIKTIGGENIVLLDVVYNASATVKVQNGIDPQTQQPIMVDVKSDGKSYFHPQVGDVVKQGTLELVCISLDDTGISSANGTTYTKNSHWTILGNNEIWYTYD